MTELTCAERIDKELESEIKTLTSLWAGYTGEDCEDCDGTGGRWTSPDNDYCEDCEIYPSPCPPDCDGLTDIPDQWEDCPLCDGTGTAPEDHPDLGSIFDYGLSFDYVSPHTFTDQPVGYFRYQISWGGPSDEFRFFVNAGDLSPYRVEYWFLDWFDGAKRILTGTDQALLEEIYQSFFLDTGTAQAELDRALD